MFPVNKSRGKHMASLCENLKRQYDQKQACDVILTTTNGQSVECHTLILISASTYFDDLLKQESTHINMLDVSPIQFVVLEAAVEYIYVYWKLSCN